MGDPASNIGLYIEPHPIIVQPHSTVSSDSSSRNSNSHVYIASSSDDDEDIGSGRRIGEKAVTGHLLGNGHHVRGHNMNNSVIEDEEEEDEVHSRVGDFFTAPCRAAEQAEEFVKKVWEAGWRVVHHNSLPNWLRDNDFLHKGHRLPTNSFVACFKSVFRIHTETGNIWTHLLGMIAFLGITAYFLSRPTLEIQWQEKAVFSAFFIGAIMCLGFSWVFHTVYNHSQRIGKLFNKLDYCGIAFLTMGSFVPWLYYGFYCQMGVKIIYMVLTFSLGTACIVVSLWDKFSEPRFRALRAAVFIAFGLSGVIPAIHIVTTLGFWESVNKLSLGWLSLMAVLYITGAVIYAVRIPERLFPGKFDIWFQSHQIFHVFVIAAAFVHYHGITEIANYRLTFGDCLTDEFF